ILLLSVTSWCFVFVSWSPPSPSPSLFPYTTLFRSLAVIIGREGKNIKRENAMDHVFGYTIYNDFSAREIQSKELAIGLGPGKARSEEHTSELQSRFDIVCRLLLEKKKTQHKNNHIN